MSKADRPTFTADDLQGAQDAVEHVEEQTGAPPASKEDLRAKAESLIAKAQALLGQIEVETADPSQLEVDREVRQAINDLNEVYVSNAQPEYGYAWIFRDPHNEFGGRYVRKMLAMGWERVSGDMPEATEHNHIEGRVVADCLLMRIRLDRKMLLEKRDRLLREAQQAGVSARVYDLAERAGTRIYDKLPGFIEEAMTSNAQRQRSGVKKTALQNFHRMNSTGKVDRMLKTGSIPGIPVPGAGRG